MSKLTVIDGKQTNWEGLWWHPEYNGFSSAVISLSELRKFKGKVRLYVRKNKFYNNGENGRPNYNFCLKDAESDVFNILHIEDENDSNNGPYYDDEGKRLYTYKEVQYAIDRASEDGRAGYGYGENIVGDYLPTE